MSNVSNEGRSVLQRLMNKKTVLVLAVFLLMFSLVFPLPLSFSVPPPKKIRIGVIAASTANFEIVQPLFKEIIEPDINAYMARLPRDRFNPPVRFEFLVEDAQASAEVHLQKVQMFHRMGVDLIVGGQWSSQAAASLDYINEHGILLISASSTGPSLAIPGDNLFRLCPDDARQGRAMSAMLLSKGITKAIVIQRDDAWGNGIYGSFEAEYTSGGGTIVAHEAYPTETTDFTTYLTSAEAAATGAPDESILMLSFDEGATIITQAQDYPNIYSLAWFGSDGSAKSYKILDEAPEQACHLKIYSTLSAPTYSSKYDEMAQRYYDLIGQEMNFYIACQVDAAWLLALGVLETQSSATRQVKATDIIAVLPDVASRYFGYSGWCLLNEAGDRMSNNYDVWGFAEVSGECVFFKYGFYDSMLGQMTWYPTP